MWIKACLRFLSYICEALFIFKPAENISKLIIRKDSSIFAPFMQSWSIFFFWSIVDLQCVNFCCTAKWFSYTYCCCSVTQSCLTLRPHGLQHPRLPCPSLSPGICSNSCLLSQWCHPTISFSVTFPHFSSCPQSFPVLGSFPVNWLFESGGQSIGTLASASVLQWIFRVDIL